MFVDKMIMVSRDSRLRAQFILRSLSLVDHLLYIKGFPFIILNWIHSFIVKNWTTARHVSSWCRIQMFSLKLKKRQDYRFTLSSCPIDAGLQRSQKVRIFPSMTLFPWCFTWILILKYCYAMEWLWTGVGQMFPLHSFQFIIPWSCCHQMLYDMSWWKCR
jgi:hypothetical protein